MIDNSKGITVNQTGNPSVGSRRKLEQENLPQNLRFICSFFPSVAAICRKVPLNRQQFNKYLSGASFPSKRNLMRISTFFDLTPEEMTLPPREFQKVHRTQTDNGLLVNGHSSQHFMPAPSGPHELDRYCGFYRTFQKLPYVDTNIHVGLCEIKRYGNVFQSKFLENTSSEKFSEGITQFSKMVGTVTYEGDYIYILDHKLLNRPSYSLTVLYPSRYDSVRLVTGMCLSIAQQMNGSPYAANVAYKRVEPDFSLKEVARSLGLYSENDPTIPVEVKQIIRNRIRDDQQVLSHHFF